MIPSFRLAAGGRIDRARPIEFRFNGKPVSAFEGDTAASALLANGIHLAGRSFKYHRPRGIVAHGAEEPNALLAVDRGGGRQEPNNRATTIEAFHDLAVATQNHWPSLAFDLGALNDRLSPLFAAGFYYKTFMWPRALWKRLYEPAIRAHGGPRPRAGGARSRALSAPPRALRRACCRRRTGRPRGRARRVGHSRRARDARRRAGEFGGTLAARNRRRDRRQFRRGAGSPRRSISLRSREQRHAAAAHDGVRLLQSQPPGARRARHRSSAPAAAGLAARAAVAGPRGAGRARHRRA